MQTHASSTYCLFLLVLGPVWLVSGCGGDAISVAGETPMHYHLVCVSPADAQTAPCDNAESRALLTTWVKDALSLPHSTFSVWSVETAHQQYRHVFTACVPPTWGASVWQAKAAFIQRARQGVTGTQQGQMEPAADCHPPKPNAPGIHQLAVSPAAASLHPDIVSMVASASQEPPLHLAVVCDVSSSTLAAACNAAALLRAFDSWVAQGLARPGSSLSVAVVGPSRDTMRTVFALSVPARSVGERIAFILGARAQLSQLPSAYFAENASAIIETIHAAVSVLRERQGRYSLVVLSDLRQLSNEWDFDHTIPEPPTFLRWLKKTHLLADLRDIPVRVCGLHTHRSPGRGTHTARDAVQLQELWERTFRAAGASEVKLFSSCDAGFATS